MGLRVTPQSEFGSTDSVALRTSWTSQSLAWLKLRDGLHVDLPRQ